LIKIRKFEGKQRGQQILHSVSVSDYLCRSKVSVNGLAVLSVNSGVGLSLYYTQVNTIQQLDNNK